MTARYRVAFTARALRVMEALPKDIQQRADGRMLALAGNPRPPGVEKLAGEDRLYRIRVGDYRVVYTIHDAETLVLVVRIGHRGEVYRKLHRGRGR